MAPSAQGFENDIAMRKGSGAGEDDVGPKFAERFIQRIIDGDSMQTPERESPVFTGIRPRDPWRRGGCPATDASCGFPSNRGRLRVLF